MGAISRSETKFLAFFTALFCVVTTLPYLVGHLVSFPGTVFTDVLDHSLDTNNYLAYVHQASSGSWLFRNPMTLEPHRAVFFNLEWLVIGKVAWIFHLQPAMAADVCRLLWVVLMCSAVYWLSSFMFHRVFVRRIALVASLAGGGFGWITAVHLIHIRIDSSYFLDLTNANLFPFYWTLRVPHFLAAESFAVLGLGFFLRAEISARPRHYFACGLCYAAAGTCRPYDMLFLMAATALFLAASYFDRCRPAAATALRALPVLMCVPILGYYYWLFKMHPVFRWWSLPGNPAPAAWLMALGFGMTFILLPFSAWRLRHEGLSPSARLMLCCFVTAIILMYTHRWFHFSFQFATNIFIPMTMLVLAGLERSLADWGKSGWRTAGVVSILLVNSFTSIALTGQAILLASRGDYRIDAHLVEAYSWLDVHSGPRDALLADFGNSNAMAQYVHSSVFCGYPSAVHALDKMQALREFFAPDGSNDFRERLIRGNEIQFVFLTEPESQELGDLVKAPFLNEVFRNNAAVIFSVRPGTSEP